MLAAVQQRCVAHLLDDFVVSEGQTIAIHLAKSTLLHQLLHALEVGITKSDVGLDTLQKTLSGFGDLNASNTALNRLRHALIAWTEAINSQAH